MSIAKENVKKLYLEGICEGDSRAAVEKYTGHRYTQHSTGVADGVEGFLTFFEPFVERNPDRDIQILRLIEDGPHVFCHAFQSLNQGAAKWVTTDLFDTDSNGLIIEHWDAISAYQETTVSGEDMVGGATDVTDLESTDRNKFLVKEFVKQVLQERKFDCVDMFVAENCIQHIPGAQSGLEGLSTWFQSEAFGQYEMLFKLVGEGNFVATMGKTFAQGKEHIAYHIYRLENFKIVECWDNLEEIAPRAQWNNSGKF